jgi:tripartite-type tricarboxylate transporter receptor subunit TctC
MRLCTRRGWRDALATLCLAVVPCVAPAQTYPTKPIRILVGFAAGGPVDGVARVIAQALPAHLGQAVVVENRPGADANIAMEALARSAPDGYTLYLIQPGVVLIGSSPNLLAIARTLPAATLQEFIALAKARRGQLNYGATSSPTHLATELFNSMAGVEIVRVPFKGAPPALAALAAGDVQLVISSIGTLLPLHKAGKVRALAVTSSERSSIAPDIPTVAESGLPGYVATTWYGLAAPGATPPAIIDRLNRELRKTLAEPAVRTQLMNLGIDSITPGDPGELRELIRAELVKWDQVVKRSGARVD